MVKGLPKDWQQLLKKEFEKEYFTGLSDQVDASYDNEVTFPPLPLVFNALKLCPFDDVKVVIIGQDPYHGPGQAHGLSFSVNPGVRQPPSLKNIFKELQSDIGGFVPPVSGNLERWAKQGVLLLNAVLTVRAGKPGSHKNFGWEKFTDAIIHLVSEKKEHVVFMLWGNFAHSKEHLIDASRHRVLKAAHPSPLARGAFFGSKHFSKANNYLISNDLKPVNWRLA